MAEQQTIEKDKEQKKEEQVSQPSIKAILGTKLGMTQIFNKYGEVIPVTVLSAGPCTVVQVKTLERDGYSALQVGYGKCREKNLTKPIAGKFAKVGLKPGRWLREFRLSDAGGYQVGQQLKVDAFVPGDYVDVSGTTKGKGFAGTIKRHGFSGGPMSHGQSDYQRAPGSIGWQGPQRVIKGIRMAGHMGHRKSTVHKLEVVSVDPERDLLLVKGSVPGPNGGLITVQQTVKSEKKVKEKVKAKAKKEPAKAAKAAEGKKKQPSEVKAAKGK